MKSTLKSNLSIAEQLRQSARIIERSQIEEAVRQLHIKNAVLTPAEARETFAESFGKNIISNYFFDFCICLESCGNCKMPQPAPKHMPKSVSFIDNPNTRAALKSFGCEKGVSFSRCSDMRSCCEDAAALHENCCILPVSSTEDGIFPSFFKLVKDYELKIQSVRDIIMQDRECELRFALLSKNTVSDAKCSRTAFSFLPAERSDLTGLMSVFGSRGIEVELIYCTPCEFSIDKTEYTVCINCCKTDPLFVKFFLDAALPGNTDLGIF